MAYGACGVYGNRSLLSRYCTYVVCISRHSSVVTFRGAASINLRFHFWDVPKRSQIRAVVDKSSFVKRWARPSGLQ